MEQTLRERDCTEMKEVISNSSGTFTKSPLQDLEASLTSARSLFQKQLGA